jgi:hypothetical protein
MNPQSNIKFANTSNSKGMGIYNTMLYNPDKRIDTYYQLCQFKNPYTGHYGTRKIIFNEKGDILKMYEKEYNKTKLEEFVKHHRQNKFKIYPVSEIQMVSLPNGNDMMETQSELLNNKHTEYGHARI